MWNYNSYKANINGIYNIIVFGVVIWKIYFKNNN